METDFATADALMASALRSRAGALLDRPPAPAAECGGARLPATACGAPQADASGGAGGACASGIEGGTDASGGAGAPEGAGPASAAPPRPRQAGPEGCGSAPPQSPPPGARHRPAWREALLERLPVWVQVRCGLEPRTVAAIAVTLAAVLAFAVHHFWTGRPRTVQLPPAVHPAGSAPAAAPPAPQPSASTIAVDVAGRVHRPGVLRLPAGARVTDALQAAGGALPGTDTDALNLARVLADGEEVVVGRSPDGRTAPEGSGTGPDSGPGSGAGPAAGYGTGAGSGPGGPVSLSTATVEQLDALPGVGPVLARHIVEFRTRHGGFASLDQLHQVLGVGRRRFEDLKRLVRP